MALNFPWEMFLEAQKQKNQNQQNMQQGIAGIGQGLGQIGQGVGDSIQASHAMADRRKLQGMVANQATPEAVMAQMLQVDPQTGSKMVSDQFDPYKQAQIGELNAHANYYKNKQNAPGKPAASVWVNPDDPTDVSATEKPGYIEYKTTQGDALNKVTGTALALKKNKAIGDRAEAMQRGIDARQTDALTKSTGLTGKMLSSIQQNNMRADRATKILSNPSVTWQSLSFAITDIAGIMQGGAPHKEEILNARFPNWKEEVAKINTYATGQPTANVPPPIQQEVLRMVQELKQVDNAYLQKNSAFQKNMLIPTIRGGGRLGPIVDQGTQDFIQGGAPQQQSSGGDPLGVR